MNIVMHLGAEYACIGAGSRQNSHIHVDAELLSGACYESCLLLGLPGLTPCTCNPGIL